MSTSTLLINNHGSCSGKTSLAELAERFGSLGPVIVEQPDRPEDLPGLIRRHGPQVDQVVLGGGDGTVNLALDAVLEVNRPLGLLPIGTANDLARSLEIPEDLDQAFAIILDGHIRQIDVAYANQVSFVNAIGLGLGPQMTRQMDSETKARLGVFSYLIGVIRAFRKHRSFEVIGRLRWGHNTRAADDMTHIRCPRLVLTTRPKMEITVDGEFLTSTPLACEVRPQALKIFAPD
ncbi:MAG: hypothetical protein LC637_10510 [Xanthomonadaceae bacterium]|nr:hypothetical protein [Xanthomonadaceae bacterium]